MEVRGSVYGSPMGHLWVTVGHLRLTIGHPRVTIGHLRATMGHLRLTIGHLRVTIGFCSISKNKANTTDLHPKVRQTCLNVIFGRLKIIII